MVRKYIPWVLLARYPGHGAALPVALYKGDDDEKSRGFSCLHFVLVAMAYNFR